MVSPLDTRPAVLSVRRRGNETLLDIARRDPKYRKSLLVTAVELILDDHTEVALGTLKTYVDAQMGFPGLAELTGRKTEDLVLMFSRNGRPGAHDLFAVIRQMCRREGIKLEVQAVPRYKSKGRRKRENARHKLRIERSHGQDNHPAPAGDERPGARAAG